MKPTHRHPQGSDLARRGIAATTALLLAVTAASTSQAASLSTQGMVRFGSDAGTSQSGNRDIIHRAARSTVPTSGQVVARTGDMLLERDGTIGGVKIVVQTVGKRTLTCTGVNTSGDVIGFNMQFDALTTITVFSDAQAVTAYDCQFGNTFLDGDHTRVSMQRDGTDSYWLGFIESTYNQ